jgi:hypothetical protein
VRAHADTDSPVARTRVTRIVLPSQRIARTGVPPVPSKVLRTEGGCVRAGAFSATDRAFDRVEPVADGQLVA